MKTLLVAVRTEDRGQGSVIAANEFRLCIASSTKEALSMLSAPGIDGVVCGVHFNEGDPFEFLRQVQSLPKVASLPFIVVKAVNGRLHLDSIERLKWHAHKKGFLIWTQVIWAGSTARTGVTRNCDNKSESLLDNKPELSWI